MASSHFLQWISDSAKVTSKLTNLEDITGERKNKSFLFFSYLKFFFLYLADHNESSVLKLYSVF